MMNQIKTANEIRAIRTSGQILAHTLQYVAGKVEPGITTAELDDLGAAEIRRLGGQTPFVGYEGYPRTMCIAVNEEIQHAIPGKRVIQPGDVVNLDSGVRYDGMITDAGITVGVGAVSPAAERLLRATKDALVCGLGEVRAGARVGDVGAAIETRLLRDKLGIVRDLAGHGVGHELHEDPSIPNYGKRGRGAKLVAGMTIAIEPIAALGKGRMWLLDDGWTLVTQDNSWAAQFEHTVLVTEDGCEILTELKNN